MNQSHCYKSTRRKNKYFTKNLMWILVLEYLYLLNPISAAKENSTESNLSAITSNNYDVSHPVLTSNNSNSSSNLPLSFNINIYQNINNQHSKNISSSLQKLSQITASPDSIPPLMEIITDDHANNQSSNQSVKSLNLTSVNQKNLTLIQLNSKNSKNITIEPSQATVTTSNIQTPALLLNNDSITSNSTIDVDLNNTQHVKNYKNETQTFTEQMMISNTTQKIPLHEILVPEEMHLSRDHCLTLIDALNCLNDINAYDKQINTVFKKENNYTRRQEIMNNEAYNRCRPFWHYGACWQANENNDNSQIVTKKYYNDQGKEVQNTSNTISDLDSTQEQSSIELVLIEVEIPIPVIDRISCLKGTVKRYCRLIKSAKHKIWETSWDYVTHKNCSKVRTHNDLPLCDKLDATPKEDSEQQLENTDESTETLSTENQANYSDNPTITGYPNDQPAYTSVLNSCYETWFVC